MLEIFFLHQQPRQPLPDLTLTIYQSWVQRTSSDRWIWAGRGLQESNSKVYLELTQHKIRDPRRLERQLDPRSLELQLV